MRKTYVVAALALAAAVAAACSSTTGPADAGPTTYTIAGGCTNLPVTLSGASVTLSGICDLGPQLGDFVLDAGLGISLGACGDAGVTITADWTQGSSVLYSTFTGNADVPCSAGNSGTIPIDGTFTFAGGTGPYSDATGSAALDGGVAFGTSPTVPIGPVDFSLTGSLTY